MIFSILRRLFWGRFMAFAIVHRNCSNRAGASSPFARCDSESFQDPYCIICLEIILARGLKEDSEVQKIVMNFVKLSGRRSQIIMSADSKPHNSKQRRSTPEWTTQDVISLSKRKDWTERAEELNWATRKLQACELQGPEERRDYPCRSVEQKKPSMDLQRPRDSVQ
jgi:hypothetical protein